MFLGGTIHDVAQVVGAGYSVSKETGDVATIIKLLRVALLVPAVIIISLSASRSVGAGSAERQALIPGFLVIFVLNRCWRIVFTSSQTFVRSALTDFSRWCIVIAIAALGTRTSLLRWQKLVSEQWP